MAEHGRTTGGRNAAGIALVLFLSLCVCCMLGSPLEPTVAIGAMALKLGTVWPAALYLLAAFGLGYPLARLWKNADDRLAIQLAAGLAILFSLSHLLGVLGLLSPATGIGVIVIGVGLVAAQGVRAGLGGGSMKEPSIAWALGAPAAALLVIACTMPPGWMWASEYGGYDALSYHLQLPQEWLASGAIEPVTHNVYSYLPGYIESAFVHIGVLTAAPADGHLLAGDGWRLLSCQSLHAALAVVAALLTARAARRAAIRMEFEESSAEWAGIVAGCLAIATPWAVVTGSLAYNEAGVNAMLAGAVLVCLNGGLASSVRGALVGLLIGVACGFKPTALFFAGVPAGIVLIASSDAKGRAVTAGAGVGLVTLAPWLVRNAMHGGNPVFPFATDLLGLAHWSEGQLERYRSGHTPDGGLIERVQMLIWASPTAPMGASVVERFRGFGNPQWGLFLPMIAIAGFGALMKGRSWITLTLVLGLLAQIVLWLVITHQQSRFLLPALPLGSVVVGLGCARLRAAAGERPDARAGAVLLSGVLVAAQTAFLIGTYLSNHQNVGAGVSFFPEAFTHVADDDPAASAMGWSNTQRPRDEIVYLIGDATPLYFGAGVIYHTTYDESPLGALVREHPEDPNAWLEGLRAQGIRWLLVSPGEVNRLQESGWYDPDVTNELLFDLTESLGGPVTVWQQGSRYLVRVPDGGLPAVGDAP